jgi:dephospho-CoA kinase
MLRVALTGGIATGKSYVRDQFERLGIPTIDADTLARQVVEPGTAGLAAIVERFGPGVLTEGGRLDRARLGDIVFADGRARTELEAIVHPFIHRAIESWFESRQESLALADIPLLFEKGREGAYDIVVVTMCPADLQLARIQQRDGLSREAAQSRLAAQWPVEEKVRRADYVIRTDGSFAETNTQVAAVCEALRGRAARE